LQQAAPLQQGQPQLVQSQVPVVQQPQQSQHGASLVAETAVADTFVVNTPSRAATAMAQAPRIESFVMIVSRF
jgi:hypothetical protein